MQSLQRGQQLTLASLTNTTRLRIGMAGSLSGAALDFSCFGLDASGKLYGEDYFVFYNQKRSPCGGVSLQGAQEQYSETFDLELELIPPMVEKLVFVATIDGTSEMRNLQAGLWHVNLGAGECLAAYQPAQGEFGGEKALIFGEIYRKDGWRLMAVGQGFNGGLGALLAHFGGEEAEEEAATVKPPPLPSHPKPSLEKKLETAAPRLLSLAKPLRLSLEKQKLTHEIARVALVLDSSGSMFQQYERGDVQTIIDRVFPIAVAFDDDGELDTWAFAEKKKDLPPVTATNNEGYVLKAAGGWKKWKNSMGRGINNEPAVMRSVIRRYRNSTQPAYVIFISDGGVASTAEIRRLIVSSSSLPIFWQFVGIGGNNYGILEKLDNMEGRVVDNCNFFALDDIYQLSEQELYDRLLAEFPEWLRAARAKHIVP